MQRSGGILQQLTSSGTWGIFGLPAAAPAPASAAAATRLGSRLLLAPDPGSHHSRFLSCSQSHQVSLSPDCTCAQEVCKRKVKHLYLRAVCVFCLGQLHGTLHNCLPPSAIGNAASCGGRGHARSEVHEADAFRAPACLLLCKGSG